MQRLSRATGKSIEELEREYQRALAELAKAYASAGDTTALSADHGSLNYTMSGEANPDCTFFVRPGTQLVEYENGQADTPPYPSIPGLWSASERWLDLR